MQSIPIPSYPHSKGYVIPILMGFPLGYSPSYPISKHAQPKNRPNVYMQTVDSRLKEKSFAENWNSIVEK